jgi:hypothetical protein
MPRARANADSDKSVGTAGENPEKNLRTTEEVDTPEGRAEVDLRGVDLGKIKSMKPYNGRDSLGDPEFDKKGFMKRAGEPAYFMTGNKLIAKYKNRGGVATRLVKMFKMTRPLDKQIRAALRTRGIPGA